VSAAVERSDPRPVRKRGARTASAGVGAPPAFVALAEWFGGLFAMDRRRSKRRSIVCVPGSSFAVAGDDIEAEMRALLGAVVAGTIVVACSSFSGSDPVTSTDADASSESGSEVDAGVDTSDAATAPFCQGTPTTAFCASFDEGTPPSFDWDGPAIESNAPVTVVEGEPGTPSPPGALHVAVPRGAADTDDCLAQGQISKTFIESASFKKLHAEFMIKVDAVAVRFTYARLVTKPSPDAAGGWDLWLAHGSNSASDFGEQWTTPKVPPVSLGQGQAFKRYLLPGKWTKVAVDLTFDPPHFEVFFDGVSVASRDSVVATSAFAPLSATLTIGAQSGECPGDIDVSFDNVKFSFE